MPNTFPKKEWQPDTRHKSPKSVEARAKPTATHSLHPVHIFRARAPVPPPSLLPRRGLHLPAHALQNSRSLSLPPRFTGPTTMPSGTPPRRLTHHDDDSPSQQQQQQQQQQLKILSPLPKVPWDHPASPSWATGAGRSAGSPPPRSPEEGGIYRRTRTQRKLYFQATEQRPQQPHRVTLKREDAPPYLLGNPFILRYSIP